MAEVLIFQCQGYYDWQFKEDDNSPGQHRAQILLGNVLVWESEVGYYDEDYAQEQAKEHLYRCMEQLLHPVVQSNG